MMPPQVLHALRAALSSQLFGGGLMLGVVGSLIAMARNVPAQIARLTKRRFSVTVDVPSGSDVFDALEMWLASHPYSQKARALTAGDDEREGDAGSTGARRGDSPEVETHSSRRAHPRVLLSPAPGHHLLWMRGRPVWLNRERKEVNDSQGRFGGWRETITITMPGRSQEVARRLFDEALALAAPPEVRVRTWQWGGWQTVSSSAARGLGTVVLPSGVAEGVLREADRFFASREWYEDRGIPWRLGFLFEGPPGTGKTSLIKALAGHYELDLYHVGIASRGMTDESLLNALAAVPTRSALLLEDIDRVLDGESVQGADGGVTFSGLLNALDGVASRPGVVTFMTTNHPERLDPALVRPGRVNHRLTFPLADRDQATRLFQHFYARPELAELAEEFGSRMAGRSPAEIQQVMLDHRDEPAAAVDAAAARPRSLEAA